MDDAKRKAAIIMRWGTIPQVSMVVFFAWQSIRYKDLIQEPWWSLWLLPTHVGFALFMSCLYILYMKQAGPPNLITTGVFKYTRHPMYTGLFMINLDKWLPGPISNEPQFYIGQSLFLICMIIAGWSQEKETLARFGKPAEDYYARTPRLFLWYPLMRNT